MSDTRAAQMLYLRGLIQDAVDNAHAGHDTTGYVVSGGLDSSTVRCFAPGQDPLTFTGWYADGPAYDERPWARMVAGQNHHEILITPQDFVDNFDTMIQHVRPPFQGVGTFGQYMVGKYIADNTDIKVVLSGEGADELFGGYARLLWVAGQPLPDGYEDYQPPEGYPETVEDALAYDYERLPLLLAVDDQCMAAHGLEARAPFTDPAIVDFAMRLPPEERVGKHYLRAAVRGIVPDQIIDRTDKRGFPIPLVAWAQQSPVKEFIGDRLGYIPDPAKPWDRGFWLELCEMCHGGEPLREAA